VWGGWSEPACQGHTRNGVVVLQNWYDANGRRIAKQERVAGQTEKWLYLYDGWDIIGVMDGVGQLFETYTRGVGLAGDIGTLVAVTHYVRYLGSGGTPVTYYLHHNDRGDVVLARNGTTTVTSYAYSAFGELKSMGTADVSRFNFSSKERDPSTGFYYYGYRFYAPQWQRWISRDLIGEVDGPNLFTFNLNNPVAFIDALGLGVLTPEGLPLSMVRCLRAFRLFSLALLLKPYLNWREQVNKLPQDPQKIWWVPVVGDILGTITFYDEDTRKWIHLPA